MGLLLSSLGMKKGFLREENFMSWAAVKSPLLYRLETGLSRCWPSPITCKIRSNRVLLSLCLASLLSMHWPEVMSKRNAVNSMCHFLSICMASLFDKTSKHKSSKLYTLCPNDFFQSIFETNMIFYIFL